MLLCRANGETGATGLEPATSGVTGQLKGAEVNDVGCVTALFMRRSTGLRTPVSHG
jgi:hypothetical protein